VLRGCLRPRAAGSPSASRLTARLRHRVHARAVRQEPAGSPLGATPAATRQGGRSAAFTYCPTGRVGLRPGVFESAVPASTKTAGHPWPSPCGPCPFAALAYGYRPRGGYPPALPDTEAGGGRAACRFTAPSAIANRVGSHHSPHAMRSAVPQPALGRSQPCWRTLNPTKANEAMRDRQASGHSNEARYRSPTRNLNVRQSRRVPPSGPLSAGEGSDWTRPRSGAGHGRPAFFVEAGTADSKNPSRSPTRSEGQ
jgi:hypothetical protein